MLHSPLFEEIRNYLKTADPEKQIFLYVPYIKTNSLEKLIDGIENKITIITNWSKRNLNAGSSELELYPYCKQKNIKLYHNEDLHLKAYSINLESMILATGNISQRGLMPDGNLELGKLIETISSADRIFLEKIRRNSVLIYDETYDELKEWIKDNPPNPPKDEKFPEIKKTVTKDDFLISALPMTIKIETLQNAYERINQGLPASDDEEINACVYHDLANYEIPLGLSQESFLELLKENFFQHPFIERIDEFLKPSARFGAVKEWIQKNCHDVPIPSRRELTGNVQVLYEWFVELGDGEYVVDVPGSYSQVLTKKDSDKPIGNILEYENEVLQILESTGYTVEEIKKIRKREGIWHVHDEPSDLSEKENASESIWHYKREADEKVAKMLSLSEEEIGERKKGHGKLYRKIVDVIRKLNNNGFIKMWHYEVDHGTWSDGIWRLTEEGKREIKRRGL